MARKLTTVRSVASALVTAFVMSIVMAGDATVTVRGAGAQTATFRTAIDIVSVTAVVRDRKGRVVRNLPREDFQVFHSGRPTAIVDFREVEGGPVSVALLFDVSGSMQVASKLGAARMAAEQVLSWLVPSSDETALYAFDTELRELQPFTNDIGRVRDALGRLRAFGATSLYDAIAGAARRVAAGGSRRAAIVVLTDGVDTTSRLTPSEVSGIASAIDVPVYLIAAVSPIDHPGDGPARARDAAGGPYGTLSDLARWTGGDLFVTSGPAHVSAAARQVLGELRHRYLIAFESAGGPGWHPLEIRTRDQTLTVRTRAGYLAGLPTIS